MKCRRGYNFEFNEQSSRAVVPKETHSAKMTDLSMIVRMVIYRCREMNNPVTETLAAYVA